MSGNGLSTTYYDRLQAVSELSLDESGERQQYTEMTQMISAFNKVVTSVAELVNQGLQGAAGDAIRQVLSDISKDVQSTLAGPVATGWAQNEASLQAMRAAGSQFQNLSTQLVSPTFWNYVTAAGMVIVPGVGPMQASEYLNNVKTANNKKREEAARQILEQMRNTVNTAKNNVPHLPIEPTKWPPPPITGQPIPDPIPQPVPTPSVSVPGLPGGGVGIPSGGAPSFDPTLGGGIPGGGVPSVPGGISSPGVSVPSPGSVTTPTSGFGPDSGLPSSEWDWSVAPVIIPNGPASGVVPPPVVNQFDPSWKTGFSTAPTGSYTGTTGSLSGSGWTGTGGYGVGGVGSYGTSGYGADGYGAGGYGAGGVGSYGAGGVGGLGAGRIGGYGAGGGGYGGVGAGPGGGASGSGSLAGAGRLGGSSAGAGLGQAEAEGAAGAAGAGKGSGGMAGGGAGGGSSKDEKLRRRKYKVMRFKADRDPGDWGELPAGAGPGRAEDLPARRPPDEEDSPW